MTTTCVNPGCCSDRVGHGGEGHECTPREVRDQAYLCRPCRSRMGRLLAELPSLHDELAEALDARQARATTRGRATPGLTLQIAVIKAREHIDAWLQGWVRVVAEERGLNLPMSCQVDTLAHWLGRHLDTWLVYQRYVDEALTNLEETHKDACRARQIVPPRRIELRLPDGTLARCPQPAEGPVQEGARPPVCGSEIGAVVREDNSLLPSEIFCTGDPSHRWPASSWVTFGRRIRRNLDTHAAHSLAQELSA